MKPEEVKSYTKDLPRCTLLVEYDLLSGFRKDKTLVEILDRLRSLEGKVDRIPAGRPLQTGFGPPQRSPASQSSLSAEAEEPRSFFAGSLRPTLQPSHSGIGRALHYRHASAAHKMLTWPAMQQLFLQALPSNIGDLKVLEQDGAAFIMRIQEGMPKLPLDEAVPERPFVGMQSQATRAAGGTRTTFPRLTKEVMHTFANAYFDTFNFIYPFMDRQNFISDTLTKVHTEGFNGDTDSVIALLVFALAELALEGYRGTPIEVYKGRTSGVRGGTVSKPPGLALFNEARKRIGFTLTDCELENVQIYCLTACVALSSLSLVVCSLQNTHVNVNSRPCRLYYGSCSHHVVSFVFKSNVIDSDIMKIGLLEIDGVGIIGLSSFSHMVCQRSSHFDDPLLTSIK